MIDISVVPVKYRDGDREQYTRAELEDIFTAPLTTSVAAPAAEPKKLSPKIKKSLPIVVREKRHKRGETLNIVAELALSIVNDKPDTLAMLLVGNENLDLGMLDLSHCFSLAAYVLIFNLYDTKGFVTYTHVHLEHPVTACSAPDRLNLRCADVPLSKKAMPPNVISKAGNDVFRSPGSRLLHLAAHMGSTDCVRILVDRGASLKTANSSGFSAMHFAAASGGLTAVEMLAGHDKSAVDRVDTNGKHRSFLLH